MMPQPTASTAPSIDPTQRKLIIGIAMATLITLLIVIADLATGGRPDPPALRAAATLLDGSWRFHTGDDPRWAGAATDDTGWETIDMTALPGSHDGDVGLPDYVGGWMAHGHPGHHGYELYWNGQLLGGSGRLGPDPRLVGTRPLEFTLPANAAGTRGVLAIRTYMLPGSAASADGGGLHSAPILAPQPTGDALHRVQWQRTIAGYLADAVEPLAMLALIGLALGCGPRSNRKGFLVFAGIALALTAARRLNNAIVAWTDLQDLTTYAWLASVMWVPAMAAWVMAWNRWCLRPWRSIDVLAVVLGAAGIVGALSPSATWTSVSRLGSIALFVVIGARMLRSGPLRLLSLVTLAAIMASIFGSELLDTIGVPGIWFQFGIGVARVQYIYAIAIPLLAVLIVRTLRTPALTPGSGSTLPGLLPEQVHPA